MSKRAVFLFGVFDKVAENGVSPLSDQSLKLCGSLAEELDLEVLPVIAVPLQAAAGAEYIAKKNWQEHFRQQTLKQINAFNPDYVFCFGKVAAGQLLRNGSVVLKDHYRRRLSMPDVKGDIFVVDSLLRVAAQPGIEKWIRRHMKASIEGFTDTTFGDYDVLLPGTPEWDVMPDRLATDLQQEFPRAVGFDLETYPGLDPWHPDARIRMGMLSAQPGYAVVVQCDAESNFPEWFQEICADPGTIKAGSNIAFDVNWMRRFGYDVNNVWDTKVAEHLIDETDPNKSLKDLTYTYLPRLGDYAKPHHDLVRQRGGWQYVDDDEQYDYAGADAEASIASYQGQVDLLTDEGEDRLRALRLAMDLYPVLTDMQIRGICIDMDENTRLHGVYETHLTELRREIQKHIGPINPASPEALAKALKSHVPGLDITTGKLTKVLKYDDDENPIIEDAEEESTGKSILKREKDKHPVIPLVLEFRKWNKMYGTYVKGLAEKHVVTHPDGNAYIHASFNQDRVETHRLSSSQPNMQNIPRKPGEGDPDALNVKRQFVSRWEGGSVMEFDYSQAELRVAAMLSGDKNMIAALTSGRDVHKETAAMLLKKEFDDITDPERQRCKTLNFLIIYGGGANTLAAALGIEKDEAKDLMKQYFMAFPQLRKYINEIHRQVREDLYVVSPFGYKRRFRAPPEKPRPEWDDNSDNDWKYDRWNQRDGWQVQRQAFNMLIQNSAACYTFLALIGLDEALAKHGHKSRLCGTVHDSILVDVYPGEEAAVAKLGKQIMEGVSPDCMPGTVPMLVDVEAGPTWGDKQEVEL